MYDSGALGGKLDALSKTTIQPLNQGDTVGIRQLIGSSGSNNTLYTKLNSLTIEFLG
jgi:hypothetical protein